MLSLGVNARVPPDLHNASTSDPLWTSRRLNIASWAVLLAAFPLIFMGGLVTTKGAGMSVPDWPNSYGYNMFLFPPSKWQGGIFFEHTHRLLGTLVGMLSIIQVIVAWVWERRRWVNILATAMLLAIIIQGILGGLRVDLVNIHLAVIHGIFAQLVVCGLALACVVTSRWWAEATPSPMKGNLAAVGFVMFAVISLQLVIGAMMRHYGAGLAVPDIPLIYGKLVPPTTDAGLAAANAYRVSLQDATLAPTTLGKIWLHAGHRYGATIVAIGIAGLIWHVLRGTREAKLRVPAYWLCLLIVMQISLGLLTVYFRKDAIVTTGHHMVGALMLVTTFVLAVRAARLQVRSRAMAPPGVGNLPRDPAIPA